MKLKINGFLTLLVVLATQITFAQDRSVSGTVSDNAGLPIPGATVLVKGSKTGTQTDANGKYTIKADENETLVISYIGMASKQVSAKTATVNVKLADDAVQLEGVVVTALGIKREKKSLGYASQEIKAVDLNSGSANGNFMNDLSGKVAGVSIRRNNNFGGSTNLVSRGIKSLTGNNQMLVVVDGLPLNNSNSNSIGQDKGDGPNFDYGNTANDINPDDIESVNILKGAAASALYGYQAANGVLLITTKKGKKGKGLGVTYRTELVTGNIDKSTFPKYQNKYGAGYGLYYGPGEDSYFNEEDINGDGIVDKVVPTYEDASYGAPFDPTLNVYQWDAFTTYSPNYGKATPWTAAKNGPITFFETPVSINNSFSLEGANDKSSYVVNFSNLNQTGLMPNSNSKKNNVSVKFTHDFSDKLSGTFFANYIASSTLGRNSTGYSDNIMSNFRQWWEVNVDIQALKDVYEKSGGQNITWNIKSPSNTKPAYWDNPYFTRYKNYQNDSRNRFVGYGKLDYKINNWLSATGRISTDTYQELQEERRAGGIPATFGINGLDESSGYQRYNRNYSENNFDLIFNFKKNLSENLNLTGLVGGTINRQTTNTVLASTQGGLLVPDIYALQNSKSYVKPLDDETKTGTNSYYASASLGYKNYLYLDATVRRDAFSTLPKDNNVIIYPSVSSSFVFSNLLKDEKWLSFGKLRLNYAQVGSTAEAKSLYDTYVYVDAFGKNPLFRNSRKKNFADLKPVTTSNQEIGLEMSFLDKRLGFDIAAYKSLSKDQIFNVPFSNATGYNTKVFNAGSVENKGIEIQLNGSPIKTEDFEWELLVNWATNKNKVVELNGDIQNLELGRYQGGVTVNAVVGEAYGVLKGSDFKYLNGERIVGANGRYSLNTSTDNIIGNINPDWTGGVRNKLSYKNLSMAFLIDVQKGGSIFSLDQYYGLATGLYEETAGLNELGNPVRNPVTTGADSGGIILPGVKADGTPNTTRTPGPQFFGNLYGYRRQPAKAFVYDASYVKLREVSVSYRFSKSIIEKLKLQDLKVSLVGTNLWIISKNLPNADPESGLSSGNLSGYTVGSLPTTRNIGCNLTLNF